MQKKGAKSYLLTVGGAIVVFLLVAIFLGSLRSTKKIVVAKASIPAGARLTANYLELREIHTADTLPNALEKIEDAEGQVLTIARAPGDQITADMLGDAATVGLANQLQPGHRAVAVHVDQASGLVGIVRPGDRVAVVAVVDPQDAQMAQATRAMRGMLPLASTIKTTSTMPIYDPAPAAYIVVSGLRVLLVPQMFRYEETLPDEKEGTFAVARTSMSAQRESVVLLDVPVEPVEIADGVTISPAALLPLLDAKARVHLLLEPVEDDHTQIEVGAELGDLYRAMIGWVSQPVTDTLTVEATMVMPEATAVITGTGKK